jgi:two-component system, OmpR family, sensor histidine kinase CreC
VSVRLRLFLGFFLLLAAGLVALLRWVTTDLRPQPLKATEESLADTAQVLASLLESRVVAGRIDCSDLAAAVDIATRRTLDAKIYELTKRKVALRVYVTDRRGRVIYDSDGGRDVGRAYAGWNDVHRTLKGEYGARATRSDPNDFFSTVLYVAAPIRSGEAIVGALSVGKPVASVKEFMTNASRDVLLAGLVALVLVGLLSLGLATWITLPIKRLTAYAEAISEGRRPAPPRLDSSEVGTLGRAFESMRDALEGKHYVEGYVRSLTHEIKGPLTAIRAAAELLEEPMPDADRRHFVANVRTESRRLQLMVDRMLELSALESRKTLEIVEPVDLGAVIDDVLAAARPVAVQRGVALETDRADSPTVRGDRFLIRQALHNLVQNALDFTPSGGTVRVGARAAGPHACLTVSDTGPGVPEYALPRVFERFYSVGTAANGGGRTGLGLAFVREVAALHCGEATLDNRPEGGAIATVTLAIAGPTRRRPRGAAVTQAP